MLAHAFKIILAVTDHAERSAPDGLIPVTCNEIHHLFNTLTA